MQKLIFLTCFLLSQTLSAQTEKIISGPMIGYIEHREALVWIELAKDVDWATLKYHVKDNQDTEREAMPDITFNGEYRTVKFTLTNLQMNTVYDYDIYIDDEKVNILVPTSFKTKELWEWRKPAPDFSFLIGSCFYINDMTYDRPGNPYGQNPKILETMGDMPSDFMVWLGDNLYLREADYSSPSGIAYRYSYNFKIPEIQKLRATRANYAIWDDHDFGPDDSDGTFELKETTLQAFKNYWGNKTFGEADNAGTYHKFQWSDAEFFMMDDRYHRTPKQLSDSVNGKPNPDKFIYGQKQLTWLKNSLITSHATFKFIVSGGQLFNSLGTDETFLHYPAECNDLLVFIEQYKISGIIWLTGDRHFTELITYKTPTMRAPMYEYTNSAVTSGVYKPKGQELVNPQRIVGSLLTENNFGRISISGAKNKRQVTIETIDIDGKTRFNYVIKQ